MERQEEEKGGEDEIDFTHLAKFGEEGVIKQGIEGLRTYEPTSIYEDGKRIEHTKNGFINAVFRTESFLSRENFIELVSSPKHNWIFNQ